MERIKRIFTVMTATTLSLALHTTVYASGDANAVADILNNQRYEGAIESIQAVTEIVDTGFTMFITFIAFFIISAAMLRNVLAGAYCAYPKFWDKVDAAHKEVQDTGWVTRIKGLSSSYQNINAGSFGKALLRILPNIKMLTDFEEEAIEPKSYFIKAIPQMIAVVIIGVFIYNGYYRDTAATVSNFGSELFKRVLLSADPVSIYDRITGAAGRPEFATDSDKTDEGQLINKISEKCYSKVISTYSDVKGSANKAALATALEKWVTDEIKECSEYASNHDNWAYSFDVTMTVGKSSKPAGLHTSTDGLKAACVFNSKPIDSLNLDTTKEQGVDWNLNVTINFKKRAAASKTKTVNDLVMKLSTVGTKYGDSKYAYELPTSSTAKLVVYQNGSKIGDIGVEIVDGKLVFDRKPDKTTLDCVGVSYKDSTGKQHKVTQIILQQGQSGKASAKFSSKDYGISVNYGDKIDTTGKTKKDDK